jgi:hypothetical protein
MGNISEYVGNPHSVFAQYLEKVHWWMPIISKKRLYRYMHDVSSTPGAEFPLLILTMKVLLWNPSEQPQGADPKSQAYSNAKHAILEAVTAGILTLQLLQAQLLIAMYELGHAIYPAANLSIGACARYGIALGLDASLRPDSHEWSSDILELEEKRRTWWIILILDR